ncbi:transcriptional corepressor LEUNIG-like isoform X1 [Quercus robur]|uniref:transcriptional corepressor LEUNIG-like isoform X1 n=1 Tax=Quercus robur TaxID=38942 RepID=UPI002161C20A|nr:transcriptional corepressor LEUNIG-like isoform X1 [Quercus robur]XP_050287034.1 transcriptional corepressor LEUNIG-like isoform X1 [Quercus robur]
MASGSGHDWDAEKMFELYLLDYMVKKNMHKTAQIFRKEAKVCNNPVVIDSAEGFLYEWWSIFYDVYASRQLQDQQAKAEASTEATQMTENEQQNIYSAMPQLAINQHRPGKLPVINDFDKMLGQPASCLLAAKMYEERLRHPTRTFEPNLRLVDVSKLNLPKSPVSSSHPQQQIHKQANQQGNRNDIGMEKTVTMDPMLYGIPKLKLPISRPHDAGMNEGVNSSLLDGWPLTVLNPVLQAPSYTHQFQMLTPECQQALLAQVLSCTPGNQTDTFPGSPANFASPNVMLPKIELSVNDEQILVQTKQNEEHQYQNDQIKQQKLLENGRKRKTRSYSRAGEKTLGCINGNSKPVENVESNAENAGSTSTPFSSSKIHSKACTKDEHKGFTFEKVITLHSSKNKGSCCHFSSDGKLLASAGHENKVLIWNVETFGSIDTAEGHSHLITDVRFRPSSTIFATSSFDRTVKLWDAASPTKSLCELLGHAEQVMSVDFHPTKLDLLCSCDSNNEIRLWNVTQYSCTRVTKGATKQVRFQPQFGKLLATAAGNGIHIIDVENDSLQFFLKGHVKDVLSICWDTSGKYIASISEDSARVWSTVSGGKCIHELHLNGKKFQSCTFHPGYSQLLIIGGYQSLELWNPTENSKTWSVPAHNGLIAALTDSPQTEMVASASNDHCVKLWK